jgi:glycosyltransferase involved in cell wall biosynthesis
VPERHNPARTAARPRPETAFRRVSPGPLVSISDDQRRPIPGANWQATVYHGLPHNLHTFRSQPGEYLAFLGRISPEKRLDRAIEIARRTGRKLKVACKIYPEERAYYQQTIEPMLQESRELVEFVGEVGGREKDELLGNAYALLFPIDWPEPFGLVMIEALACGTPVIAWCHGSVPEVIADGVTGYVVDSIEQAVAAVGKVADLSRRRCRSVFEERFEVTRMVRHYVGVYRRLVEGGSARARQAPSARAPLALAMRHGPDRSRLMSVGAGESALRGIG